MPREAWGSKMKGRDIKGEMMMLWEEDALRDTKMPEIIKNSRGWVGKDRQQTHIPGDGMFLEISFSYSLNLSFSFSHTQENTHMVHTEQFYPTYLC